MPCDVVNINRAILDEDSEIHQRLLASALSQRPSGPAVWGLDAWSRFKVDKRESRRIGVAAGGG